MAKHGEGEASNMIALQRRSRQLLRSTAIAAMPLNIVVIGAGLGGLAAALSIKQESPDHDVLVVESTPVLAEVRSISVLFFWKDLLTICTT